MHHPRPGSEVSAQSTRSAAGLAAAEAPTAKIGSAPENDSVPESTAMRSIASAPESVVTAQTAGGGGGVPGVNTAGRATNLPRVSSAPVTRSVVIRRSPQAAGSIPAYLPPSPQSPSVVALAAPPSDSVEPEASQRPAGPLAPSPTAPQPKSPLAPGNSGAPRSPRLLPGRVCGVPQVGRHRRPFRRGTAGRGGHHGIHPRRRLRGLSPGQGAAAGAPGSRTDQFPALGVCECAEQWVYRFH